MTYSIGIVVAEFNSEITMKMLERAEECVKKCGGEVSHVIKVPGVFDMPLAVKRLLEQKDVDAVATLGAVIKGGTDHDQIVAHNAARKIADLSVELNKPVSLGVSGPGMTRQQAGERADDYVRRAVDAVFTMLNNLKELK